MTAPIRLAIYGATGRMGQALMRLSAARADCALVAAVSRAPIGGNDAIPWFEAQRVEKIPPFDVAIDFSLPAGFDAVLALCVERGAALVSGTTGLSDMQQASISSAAQQIPLLWASNFSLGVAVLNELVRRTAAMVPGWDCDIVESHHTQKRDAPSGTAVSLAASIESVRGRAPHVASVRAGDIVGEHAVQFATRGERLELVHRATDRDIFARGALECAVLLHGRASGNYAISRLLLGDD